MDRREQHFQMDKEEHSRTLLDINTGFRPLRFVEGEPSPLLGVAKPVNPRPKIYIFDVLVRILQRD